MITAPGEPSQSPVAPPQRRVARNAWIYLLSQVVSWAVTLISVSIVPRRLGEQSMGELATVAAVAGIVGSLFSFGIEPFLIKEIGRDRRLSERLTRAAIGLHLCIIPVAILVMVAILLLMHVNLSVWHLLVISLIGGFIGNFSEPLRSVLAGWEEAEKVAGMDLLLGTPMLLSIPFLMYGPGALVWTQNCISAIVLFFRYKWVRPSIRVRPSFDPAEWKHVALGGLPFAVNNVIAQLYAFMGVFIVQRLMNTAAVGVFTQAQKLFGTFLFLPTALGAALLPSLARLAEAGQEEMRQVESRIIGFLIVMGLPLTVGVILLAPSLCRLLYGTHKFLDLPFALQLAALGLIPMYLVTILYQFLIAQNKSGAWNRYLLATAGIFSVSAWLLVPLTIRRYHNGVAGATLATVLAETCGASFALMLLGRNPFTRELVARIVRTITATTVMGLVIWLTRGAFILVPAVLGTVTFVIMGGILHVLLPEEQEKLVGTVRRKLGIKHP